MVVDGGSQAGKCPSSTAPATKSALQGPHNIAPATKFALQGPQRTAPATKSENEPYAQKSWFIAPATKSEHAEDHHHIQSTAPATKSVHRHKATQTPIYCACHEKPAVKSDHQVQKCARHHNESAPPSSTIPRPTFFARLCAEKLHLEISERNFSASLCSQNARAQRACLDRTRAFTPTVRRRKNPSVWTHCLGKYCRCRDGTRGWRGPRKCSLTLRQTMWINVDEACWHVPWQAEPAEQERKRRVIWALESSRSAVAPVTCARSGSLTKKGATSRRATSRVHVTMPLQRRGRIQELGKEEQKSKQTKCKPDQILKLQWQSPAGHNESGMQWDGYPCHQGTPLPHASHSSLPSKKLRPVGGELQMVRLRQSQSPKQQCWHSKGATIQSHRCISTTRSWYSLLNPQARTEETSADFFQVGTRLEPPQQQRNRNSDIHKSDWRLLPIILLQQAQKKLKLP